MKRRNFFKLAVGGLAIAAVPAYGAWIEPGLFEVVEQWIPLRGIGSGFHGLRAVQISDVHIGPWFPHTRLERVIQRIIELEPELVFFTGDYLMPGADLEKMLSDLFDPLHELANRTTVFSVLGNHDLRDGKGVRVTKMLKEAGVQDVTNSYLSYQRGGEKMYMAGVGTLSTGHMGLADVSKAVPTDAPAILLAHEPDVAQWTRDYPQFVLQLSGHSHGGQIVLPFSGPTILPWMGEIYPVGLYDLDSMYLYTNRGLGMTGIPARINCPPEITLFTFARVDGM